MPVTTIQATAKRHKANMFAGVLVLAAGVVLIITGAQGDSPGLAGWGALMSLGGLAWYGTARLLAWWHHA